MVNRPRSLSQSDLCTRTVAVSRRPAVAVDGLPRSAVAAVLVVAVYRGHLFLLMGGKVALRGMRTAPIAAPAKSPTIAANKPPRSPRDWDHPATSPISTASVAVAAVVKSAL